MNTQATPRWEEQLKRTTLVIVRLGLAYLFFTQLLWKMPPTFGCPPDFKFTTANADGKLARTNGLCDWIGIEQVWSTRPHPLLVANIDNQGPPEISIDIAPLARLNGIFIEKVIMPTIRVSGWLIFGGEAFIFISLFLGLFSRLGALIALAISGQLVVGLAGISNPSEWEWGYTQIFLLSLVMLGTAPGRIFGLDALLRPRLKAAADGGNRLAGLCYHWLT